MAAWTTFFTFLPAANVLYYMNIIRILCKVFEFPCGLSATVLGLGLNANISIFHYFDSEHTARGKQ